MFRPTSRFPIVAALMAIVAPAAASAQAIVPQTPPAPSPADFVTAALGSDQYEITAAQDALTASQNPAIRTFAREMITEHGQTSQTLMAAAARSGITPPPPSMSADQAHLLAAIQSLSGASFDAAYAHQQVIAHTEALVVQQGYAANGTDANLRQAAQGAVPIIQRHLAMADQLAAQFPIQ